MKKSFILIISVFFMFFVSCGNDEEQDKINEQTAIIPDTNWYLQRPSLCTLSTVEELAGLSLLVNGGKTMTGKTIVLDTNISFDSGKFRWIPIGKSEKEFNGTFDGNGFVVSGIYLYSANENQGFFGSIGSDAVIKNLGLEDLYIDGSQRNVGGLAGMNRARIIQNCWTKGEIKGSGDYTGGLVGYNDGGRIENCYSQSDVSGKRNVGGLVGVHLSGKIYNSYYAGIVRGDSIVGGLAGGVNYGTIIENSYYDKEKSGLNDSAKGEAKTSAEMKQESTYAGWNFGDDGCWRINSSDNGGYPSLLPVAVGQLPSTYIVWFESDGGTQVPSQTVNSGEKVTPPPAPEKANYSFVGWFKDTDLIYAWNFDTDIVDKGITLYAKWAINPINNKYTVSFKCEGGTDVKPQIVNSGEKVKRPENPINPECLLDYQKESRVEPLDPPILLPECNFDGWYKDDKLTIRWDFENGIVSENMTLYGQFSGMIIFQ